MEQTKIKKIPKKYSELTNKEKAFRIFNLTLNLILLLFTIGLLIYYFCVNDPKNRVMACVVTILFLVIPILIEIIFKTKISNIIFLIYLLYVAIAAVWGASLNAYNEIYALDKIVHFAFGYVGCVAGLIAVCKLENCNNLKPLTIIFVCFAVSMACGAIWEIMEFASDQFLGQTAQGIPDANGVVSVLDTMLDLCCNFGGAIIFVIHYSLHLLTKKDLLIGYMKSEFSRNPLLKEIEIKKNEQTIKEKN